MVDFCEELANPGHPGKRKPAQYRRVLRDLGLDFTIKTIYFPVIPLSRHYRKYTISKIIIALSRVLMKIPCLIDKETLMILTAEVIKHTIRRK